MDQPMAPNTGRGEGMALLALVVGVAGAGSCGLVGLLGLVVHPNVMLVALALPVVGALAIALGVIALRRIARAEGREGRGFAAIAVIVGIAVVVIPGAFGVGVLRTYLPVKQRVAPVVDGMASAARAGRPDRAAEGLSAGARESVGAEGVDRFFGRVRAELGDDAAAEVDWSIILRSRRVFMDAARDGRLDDTSIPSTDVFPKPMELAGSRGRAVVFVALDEEALEREEVRVIDILVVLDDGRGIVLREDGPMGEVADYLGLDTGV